MSNKRNSTIQSDSIEVSGVIINKAVENLTGGPTKQVQSETNEADRRQRIAAAAYYRAERRDFNSGDQIQDWLEAEVEIDSVSQTGGGADY